MLAAEARTRIEAHAIEHAVERLTRRYAGRHSPETVRQTVEQVTDRYATAEIHAFVPVLVERDTRRILDAG
ncbi:hypothetical protein ABZS66_51655 [Dactylosporangium sp. NPDC005572]|uniref:three-helix bundle dimerization domain-containing protein n=1 Tax=Dactylosporangium sp. NPDC005572 TaxID=3156889 RepID=UPI0033AFD3F7